MKMNYTTGAELTAIPSDNKTYRVVNGDFNLEARNLMLAHSTLIQYQLKKRKWEMGKKLEGTIDGHCVEIKSPPFDSEESAIAFFNDFVEISGSYGFKPQHPKMVCGGNHIHFCFFPHQNDYISKFDIQKSNKRKKWILGQKTKVQNAFAILQKLEMECLGHYYVPWVFLHPDDIESGNNHHLTNERYIIDQLKGEIRESIEEADANRQSRKQFENYGNAEDNISKKYENEIRAATNENEYISADDEFFRLTAPDPNGRYFRYVRPNGYNGFKTIFNEMGADKENWFTVNCSWEKPPTFEFRCFEMPETEQQFKHQYEFAEALVKYVLNFPKEYYPTVEFMGRSVLNQVSFEHCRDKFNSLLVKIGLDPADYAIYVERNMKPRFAKGYVRR